MCVASDVVHVSSSLHNELMERLAILYKTINNLSNDNNVDELLWRTKNPSRK